MNTAMTGLRRDGHLTDLALEHLLDGEPLPQTEEHLVGCATCRARLDALRAEDAIPLPALPPMASLGRTPAAPKAANRPWRWFALGAAAATALFVARGALQAPSAPPDGFRVKGSPIALQVFRDAGPSSERLHDGDTIAPGDRLGFRIRQRDDGHVMVLGVDESGEPYLCYPQSLDGRSAYHEASVRPEPLPEAIRMDDTRGSELLVAVLCPEPFTFDAMGEALVEDRIPEDCATDRVELFKP